MTPEAALAALCTGEGRDVILVVGEDEFAAGEWRDQGSGATGATVFEVRGGRVVARADYSGAPASPDPPN